MPRLGQDCASPAMKKHFELRDPFWRLCKLKASLPIVLPSKRYAYEWCVADWPSFVLTFLREPHPWAGSRARQTCGLCSMSPAHSMDNPGSAWWRTAATCPCLVRKWPMQCSWSPVRVTTPWRRKQQAQTECKMEAWLSPFRLTGWGTVALQDASVFSWLVA